MERHKAGTVPLTLGSWKPQPLSKSLSAKDTICSDTKGFTSKLMGIRETMKVYPSQEWREVKLDKVRLANSPTVTRRDQERQKAKEACENQRWVKV